jgi:hypothetical protein
MMQTSGEFLGLVGETVSPATPVGGQAPFRPKNGDAGSTPIYHGRQRGAAQLHGEPNGGVAGVWGSGTNLDCEAWGFVISVEEQHEPSPVTVSLDDRAERPIESLDSNFLLKGLNAEKPRAPVARRLRGAHGRQHATTPRRRPDHASIDDNQKQAPADACVGGRPRSA